MFAGIDTHIIGVFSQGSLDPSVLCAGPADATYKIVQIHQYKTTAVCLVYFHRGHLFIDRAFHLLPTRSGLVVLLRVISSLCAA